MKNSKHRKTGNWIVAATLTNKKHPNQKTTNEQNRMKLNRDKRNNKKKKQNFIFSHVNEFIGVHVCVECADITTERLFFETANIVYKI